MNQWLIIKNKYPSWDADLVFSPVCKNSFLSYAMFLIRENKIDIHAASEYAFRCSCENGDIEMARWLIYLGESEGYNKIDIHVDDEDAFYLGCGSGNIEIARW